MQRCAPDDGQDIRSDYKLELYSSNTPDLARRTRASRANDVAGVRDERVMAS